MADSIKIPSVELNAKYASAWNEINVRIAQRQSILSFYTTVALATISVTLSKDSAELWRIVYAIPPLSVLFAFLIQMHEVQIALSRSFLSDLEHFSEKLDDAKEKVPQFYHNNSKRSKLADEVRRIHDNVCFWLIIGFTTIASIIIVKRLLLVYESGQWNFILLILEGIGIALSIGLIIFSLRTVRNIQKERDKAFDESKKFKDDK